MSRSLFLLDTSVLVLLVRGGERARAVDARFSLREESTATLISIVTHGEIGVIAKRRSWGGAKLDALRDALDDLVAVDIRHPDIIGAYVETDLFSQDHADGARNMGKNDLWIAACAKAVGATLLSTDKDFVHLAPALLEVEWIDPTTIV